jgi:hypothetical protein
MSSEISVNSYLSDLGLLNRDDPNSEDALTRKVDKNIFVQTTITLYDRENLKNDTLWEQFRKNFVDWSKMISSQKYWTFDSDVCETLYENETYEFWKTRRWLSQNS